MKKRNLTSIIIGIALILSIPLVAMQFTNEVNWTILDFAVAGILLLGTALFCEIVVRKIKDTKYKIILCSTILLFLVLVWIELAVGIFGSPFAGS